MRLDELDLDHEWNVAIAQGFYLHHQFVGRLAGMVEEDVEAVAERVKFCASCGRPKFLATMSATSPGGTVLICEPCLHAYYRQCGGCRTWTTSFTNLDEETWCEECRDERYFHCRTCNRWINDEEMEEHEHLDDSCCVSPEPEFTFPNRGERLANDVITNLSLSNEIDPAGITEIRRVLNRYSMRIGLRSEVETRAWRMWRFSQSFDVGNEKTSKAGNFPTRLKRQAYKEYKLKIDPEILAEIGNLASIYSRGADLRVAVTRNLNLPAHEFAHSGSCWWTDYRTSRCALKTNGGLGIRSFADNGRVNGRAWILPLTPAVDGSLSPTFRTTGKHWLVFNAYGELNEQLAARVVSYMTEIPTFNRVDVNQELMYINNATGYLIAPQEALNRHTSLRLTITQHANLHTQEREMAHA